MNLYSYDGPVMSFDRCIDDHFKAQTMAISEKKARTNLAHQFKLKTGLSPQARISIPGKIKLEGDNV